MTWYELFLFVHVTGAIIWIGGAFIFQIYGMVEVASGDRAAIARFAGNVAHIGERVFIPTSLIVVLAGISLMINGDWPWGRLWVLFALSAFAASFLLGVLVLAPTAKRIPAVGAETNEGQGLIRKLFALLKVDLLFMFGIVFAMTTKPTGDDTLVVIVAAAVLLAGSAYFLNQARSASA